MSARDLTRTRRDLTHTPVAEEFIAARARRGARRRHVGPVDVIVLEARRSAVDLALVRARAAREAARR